MKSVKKFLKIVLIGLISFFSGNKSKASNIATSNNLDARINSVRKNIKSELKDKSATEISIDFGKYTNTTDWVNWGNWGNWNNWSNWGNWKDWSKWNNWNDFSNWQKFSNY